MTFVLCLLLAVSESASNRLIHFNQARYWSWCVADDHVLRRAWNTVGKDRHQSWDGRKVCDGTRNEASVRPVGVRINQQENNLAVIDAAQLDDGIIA